jgi:hypothetical protein
MSVQRQLNALLFELQTAQSPLAQAKILARSWRTVRELSPTDRRLLARQAGFDGAEQILEGLATKKAGLAPARLLQVLNTARGTDGAEVSQLLAAIRDPSRRDEAISRGADLVSELLSSPEDAANSQEIDADRDDDELVAADADGTPEEAPAAFNALHVESAQREVPPPKPDRGVAADSPASPSRREVPPPPVPQRPAAPAATQTVKPRPKLRPARKAASRATPSAGWDSLDVPPRRDRPDTGTGSGEPSMDAPASPRFDARAVFAALGASSSSFSRLRALDREIKGFGGSSLETLREVLDTFPDGWVRRRALAALISEGIPTDPQQALELIGGLEREIDRRWCLGALARRGDLKGAVLERSLGLVASPAWQRRLQTMAGRSCPVPAEDGQSPSL